MTAVSPPEARAVAEALAPLPAVEQLALLCDPGSLQLIQTGVRPSYPGDRDAPGDGVITGAGTVDGQPVFCFAQDPAVLRGTLGAAGAESIVRVLDLAGSRRTAVVGCLDSGGARIQEGSPALAGYARIFTRQVAMQGKVPQIMVVTGVAAGGSAYAAALADFRIMTSDAAMFLTGPKVVEEVLGESVSTLELGGAAVHRGSGLCDFAAESVPAALSLARELLGLIGKGAIPAATRSSGGDAEDPGGLVPNDMRKVYDVRRVVAAIVDGGESLEASARYGRSMFTGFGRIGGRPVAIVANQPRHLGGVIDIDGAQKGAAFVRRVSALGMPLVVLVDTPGFLPGRQHESAGIIGRGAELLRAFAGASTPRMTVVLRRALGGGFITMNSRDLGADFAFAWTGAQIGVMGARQAVSVLHGRRLTGERHRRELEDDYLETQLDARVAAESGVVDEVIEPAATRDRLAWALEVLGGGGGSIEKVEAA